MLRLSSMLRSRAAVRKQSLRCFSTSLGFYIYRCEIRLINPMSPNATRVATALHVPTSFLTEHVRTQREVPIAGLAPQIRTRPLARIACRLQLTLSARDVVASMRRHTC